MAEFTAEMLRQVRAAFAQFPLTSTRDPLEEVRASMEARYRAKLAKWERDRPRREAAEAAMQRAHARRAAELGTRPGRSPVLASLWANEPERPVMW